MKYITPHAAFDKIKADPKSMLIDVRTPVEFESKHATGATNLPLDEISCEELKNLSQEQKEKTFMLLCQSGTRAKTAIKRLEKECADNVFCVDGGTNAWESAGLPILHGKKTMSLERQVRIAAGFLVALGVTLGYFVHPGFIFLSGFVGLGLMFAGITDTCGMGIMLSKMPWNKK